MKKLRCALFPAFAVLMLLPIHPVYAEAESDGMDIEYAEIVPLAAHSLMLDIKRVGDRVVAVGERGHVVLSDDLGANWRQASVVPTRSTLTTISVVGNRLWAAGHDSVILTSGDGGDTWTRQYFDPERQQPIMDMWFADENTGIAIGAYGLMLLTEDGGQNWDDWAVNDEDDAHLNSFVKLADGTLLIAGEAGYSYRSSDAGETWESMEVPYPGSMFGAVLTNDQCILFFGLRGHIQQSCDQGDSWLEIDSEADNTLAGAVVHDSGVLIVGNSGILIQYSVGGKFSSDVHSSGVDFSSVIYLGDGRFLLAGEDGVHAYPETSQGEQQP